MQNLEFFITWSLLKSSVPVTKPLSGRFCFHQAVTFDCQWGDLQQSWRSWPSAFGSSGRPGLLLSGFTDGWLHDESWCFFSRNTQVVCPYFPNISNINSETLHSSFWFVAGWVSWIGVPGDPLPRCLLSTWKPCRYCTSIAVDEVQLFAFALLLEMMIAFTNSLQFEEGGLDIRENRDWHDSLHSTTWYNVEI